MNDGPHHYYNFVLNPLLHPNCCMGPLLLRTNQQKMMNGDVQLRNSLV